MKKLFVLLITYLSSFNIFSQSISLDPNFLQLPRLAVNPTCAVADRGKLIYNTAQEKVLYCNGTTWIDPETGGVPNNWINSGNNSYLSNLSGRVGIGTTNPISSLNIFHSTSPGTNYQTNTSGSTSTDGFFVGISNGDSYIFNYENSDLIFATNATQRMRIDASGNIGIGTTNPTYKLHVNGSVAGIGAYNNTSDGRLKKNVKAIENPLEKVLQLKGITFDWDLAKANGREFDNLNHYGFIAQEIEKILPQVVSTANDTDKTKSVAYGDVVPVLVEAIKEQQKQIEALKEQLNLISFKK